MVCPLSAGGTQEEDPLAEGRNAAEERRFSDAIVQTTDALREDPDLLEAGEPIYDAVLASQEEFNELGLQLTEVLDTMRTQTMTHQERLELADVGLDLTDQMEQVNPDPGELARRAIESARYSITLYVDRSTADLILTEARTMLDAGDRTGAIVKYLEGFELQREYFTSRTDLDPETKQTINDARRTLIDQSLAYVEALIPMLQETDRTVDAIDDSPLDLAALALQAFSTPFAQAARGETDVLAASVDLQEANLQIEQLYANDEIDRVSWHTRLLTRFLEGREDEEPEGIIVAVEGPVEESISQVTAATAVRAQIEFDTGLEPVYDGEWAAVQQALAPAVEAAQLHAAALSLEQQTEIDLSGSLDQLVNELPLEVATEVVRLRNTIDSVPAYVELADAMQQALSVYRQAADSVSELDSRRAELVRQINRIASAYEEWQGDAAVIRRQYGLVDDRVNTRILRQEDLFSVRLAELAGYEVEIVAERAELELEPLKERFAGDPGAGMRDRYNDAVDLLENGVDSDLVRFYPDRARDDLNELIADLGNLGEDVDEYLEHYRGEKPEVAASRSVQNRILEGEDLRERISELLSASLAGVDQAEEQIELALSLEQDGRALMNDAFAELDDNQFDAARQLRDQAQETLLSSLDVWYRDDLVSYFDRIFDQFLAALDAQQRELAIQDVDRAIAEAEAVVRNERVSEYEAMLADIDPIQEAYEELLGYPDPTLETLIRTMQAYLDAEGGRELAESDPDYPFLSSWLTRAKTFYSQATSATLATGTALSAEASDLLSEADDLLQRLFQQRPQNWEGRLLKVRIDLARASGDVNRLVEQRIAEIEDARIREDESLTTIRTRYEALLDVVQQDRAEVSDSLIRRMEAAVSELDDLLRPPAALTASTSTPEVIDTVSDLLQEVQSYGPVAQLSTEDNAEVQDLLSQILSIDPTNSEARDLLRAAQLSPSAPRAAAPTAETAKLIRDATNLTVRGEYEDAYGLLLQFIEQNPDQSNTDIARLIADLERRLGID